MRALTSIASAVAPKWVARVAYARLNNPQVLKLRDHELECMERASQSTVEFGRFRIQTYAWNAGASDPIVLVHGWEGQAGNFADLVDRLVAAGQAVFAFDGPAHGLSTKAPTSVLQFAELVERFVREKRPKRIVSHSFGSVATTLALSRCPDIRIEKYAMVTTPDRFKQRIDDVAGRLGVSTRVIEILVDRIERETGQPMASLNVSDYVSRIQVNDARIFHDRNDRVVDIAQARSVAAADARFQLEEVSGTGHYRILRTPAVLASIESFLCR